MNQKHSPFRYIMGRNCIREVLKKSPERLVSVYTTPQCRSDSLYKELKKASILIKEESKQDLSQRVDSDSHQSYVATVKERHTPTLKEFIKKVEERSSAFVLLLDSIYDPQNLGAILRAAECFGVDLVIFSKNRGTDLTPTVAKTSVGATELVPILKVSNLVDAATTLKKAGFWLSAAEAREDSQDLNTFIFEEKSALVLGSEGKGIQPLLSKTCDFHLQIPMFGEIDSLNVSQATAVFLSNYRRQFR